MPRPKLPKKDKKVVVQAAIHPQTLKQLNKATNNKSAWIEDAIVEKLGRGEK